MKKVVVYSKPQCPYCDRAKELLTNKGVQFNVVDISVNTSAREQLLAEGLRSVPQIYVNDELVPGGFMGLAKQPNVFWESLT